MQSGYSPIYNSLQDLKIGEVGVINNNLTILCALTIDEIFYQYDSCNIVALSRQICTTLKPTLSHKKDLRDFKVLLLYFGNYALKVANKYATGCKILCI